MGKGQNQSEHNCRLCGSCQSDQQSSNTVRGFRLIVCAFVVFVMPLIFAVVSANIVYVYYNKNSFAVTISAVIAGLITGILLAKLIVKFITNRTPS